MSREPPLSATLPLSAPSSRLALVAALLGSADCRTAPISRRSPDPASEVKSLAPLGRASASSVLWAEHCDVRDSCLIPGGSFRMRNATLLGIHGLTEVAAFRIDRYEVSVSKYEECSDAEQCTRRGEGEGCVWLHKSLADLPVNCISHAQAHAYCRFRGGRLPTLQELEWVSRNGPRGSDFPWGSATPEPKSVNLGAIGLHNQVPPGTSWQDRSASGVFDLAGNVREWIHGLQTSPTLAVAYGGSFRYFGQTVGDSLEEARAGQFEIVSASGSEFVGARCAYDVAHP